MIVRTPPEGVVHPVNVRVSHSMSEPVRVPVRVYPLFESVFPVIENESVAGTVGVSLAHVTDTETETILERADEGSIAR